MKYLDEAVLFGHTFGGQSETDGDSGEETFRHVGYDDTNKENDSVEPLVAQGQRNDEEGDAQEHGHSGDDVDEMFNLFGDGRLSATQSGSQSSNTAHYRVVSDVDDHTLAGTCQVSTVNFSWVHNSS